MWAYADQGSYKMALRKVKNNWQDAKDIATELKTLIEEKFTEEKQYAAFCDAVHKFSEEDLEWMEQMSEIEVL